MGLDGKSKGAFAFMFLVGAGLAGRFLLDLWAERRFRQCRSKKAGCADPALGRAEEAPGRGPEGGPRKSHQPAG